MISLRSRIEDEIRRAGPIPFSRYMEMCLYDPEFGYYSRTAEKFGRAGDFYTSSDVHAVFGRLLSRQFEEMWRAMDSPEHIELVEFGPGRGLFAQDVLDWSEKKFPEFFDALHYVLIESSAALRARISATLKRHFDSGKAEFHAPKFLAAEPSEGGFGEQDGQETKGRKTTPSGPLSAPISILFANEFFDALPVEILSAKGSLRINTCDNRFLETWVPSSPDELEFIDCYSVHPEPGERVEVPVVGQRYLDRIAANLHRGFFVAIDYGYTREEQLCGRHRGTLKAIRQHSVSNNPYEAPGEQDITADVNFTALAAAAKSQGMQLQKLITQSQFLMGIGECNQFADAFEECRLPQERAKVALQLKHLVTPAGMGESFHVLLGSKGIKEEKVAALSGLQFGKR